MIEVGRLCIKLAGRDAGKRCVVTEMIDTKFVAIDGETRRRKCNIIHLEPTPTLLDITSGASHEIVATLFKQSGWNVFSSKPKQRTKYVKPTSVKPVPHTA